MMMSDHRSRLPSHNALLTSLLLLFVPSPTRKRGDGGTQSPGGSLYLELTLEDGAVTGTSQYDDRREIAAYTGLAGTLPRGCAEATVTEIVGALLAESKTSRICTVTVTW
jgi:hypothetical protein